MALPNVRERWKWVAGQTDWKDGLWAGITALVVWLATVIALPAEMQTETLAAVVALGSGFAMFTVRLIGNWVRSPAMILDGKLMESEAELTRLRGQLALLTEGPRFVIGAGAVHISASGVKDESYLIAPLTVTNEGSPGVAMGWAVSVFAPSEEIVFTPLLVDSFSSQGVVNVKVQRGEFIQERTAVALDRGATVFGHLVATVKGDVRARVPSGSRIRFECSDYKGREFFGEIELRVSLGAGGATVTPTLANVLVSEPPEVPAPKSDSSS